MKFLQKRKTLEMNEYPSKELWEELKKEEII